MGILCLSLFFFARSYLKSRPSRGVRAAAPTTISGGRTDISERDEARLLQSSQRSIDAPVAAPVEVVPHPVVVVALPSNSETQTPEPTPIATSPPVTPAATSPPETPSASATVVPKKISFSIADHPASYLMLVQAQEGFGAWNDVIFEFMELAKQLNRSLVEPCVRNGCLEPCRCGAVDMVDVDASTPGAFANGADPLDLPHIDYICEPHTPAQLKATTPGRSYPLRTYINMAALGDITGWSHVVGYEEWCTQVMPNVRGIKTDQYKRWLPEVRRAAASDKRN